jgi:ferrochelatase
MTKTGVLLINLGTPDSPEPKDVYRYLIEFLTDPRVINFPWLKRQLLVRGFIVPSRYRNSARSYSRIWTEQGSPLLVYGKKVKNALQDILGSSYQVELGMRYQNPSIGAALEKLEGLRLQKLIIIPLFPQYASATTGSVHQKVMESLSRWQTIPSLRFIDSFATHPGYIRAQLEISQKYRLDQYDHILFSFHGLPKRQLSRSNIYLEQCYATASALTTQLELPKDRFTICFQSRLGKEPWIEPYTSETIAQRGKQGDKRLLVFCPSFVCDCLETLDEIGNEYAHQFYQVGGKRLDLVEGLNDHPAWIDALKTMILD